MARIKILKRYYGTDYAAKNWYFSEVTPEDRNHYFQAIVANLGQGARPWAIWSLTSKHIRGPNSSPSKWSALPFLDGNYLYFDLPVKQGLVEAGANRRTLPFV